MTKKGHPPILTGPAELEFTRLWCETDTHRDEIVTILRDQFGVVTTAAKLDGHAARRGLNRWVVPHGIASPALTMERLLTRSWSRWAEPSRPADNVVRKPVARCPVPVGGFRMGVER